jgi:hypothetical protein
MRQQNHRVEHWPRKTVSVPMGELGHCRLTFEPLPSGTVLFDFIESQNDTAFRVIGLNVAE